MKMKNIITSCSALLLIGVMGSASAAQVSLQYQNFQGSPNTAGFVAGPDFGAACHGTKSSPLVSSNSGTWSFDAGDNQQYYFGVQVPSGYSSTSYVYQNSVGISSGVVNVNGCKPSSTNWTCAINGVLQELTLCSP